MHLKPPVGIPPNNATKPVTATFIPMRVSVTMQTAAQTGLTEGKKERRLSGRTNQALLEAAALRSGLQGSELLEYALAKVALEDDFAEKLQTLAGTVDPSLDLEF